MQSDFKIFWFFAYASIFSSILPVVLGSIQLKNRSNDLKLISILSLFAFFLDILSLKKPILANISTNVYLLLEFGILLSIYAKAIQLLSKAKALFVIVIICYLGFFVTELLQSSKVEMNSYTLTFTSLLFILFSVRYFYLLIRELPTDKIQQLPMFWLNTGVLIYFAGGLFLFAIRNYVIAAFQDDQTVYWTFHNFLNVIKNILFAVAMWQGLRARKSV